MATGLLNSPGADISKSPADTAAVTLIWMFIGGLFVECRYRPAPAGQFPGDRGVGDARYRECHDCRGTRTYSSTDGAAPPSRLRLNDSLEVAEEYAPTGEIQINSADHMVGPGSHA